SARTARFAQKPGSRDKTGTVKVQDEATPVGSSSREDSFPSCFAVRLAVKPVERQFACARPRGTHRLDGSLYRSKRSSRNITTDRPRLHHQDSSQGISRLAVPHIDFDRILSMALAGHVRYGVDVFTRPRYGVR